MEQKTQRAKLIPTHGRYSFCRHVTGRLPARWWNAGRLWWLVVLQATNRHRSSQHNLNRCSALENPTVINYTLQKVSVLKKARFPVPCLLTRGYIDWKLPRTIKLLRFQVEVVIFTCDFCEGNSNVHTNIKSKEVCQASAMNYCDHPPKTFDNQGSINPCIQRDEFVEWPWEQMETRERWRLNIPSKPLINSSCEAHWH